MLEVLPTVPGNPRISILRNWCSQECLGCRISRFFGVCSESAFSGLGTHVHSPLASTNRSQPPPLNIFYYHSPPNQHFGTSQLALPPAGVWRTINGWLRYEINWNFPPCRIESPISCLSLMGPSYQISVLLFPSTFKLSGFHIPIFLLYQ